MTPRTTWLLGCLSLCACGSDAPPAPAPHFGALRTLEGAPALPDAPAATVLPSSAAVRIVASSGGLVVMGTDDGAYLAANMEADATEAPMLELLEIWSDADEAPDATGAVARAVRFGRTVLVLAEQGLFFSYGDRLLLSPDGASLVELGIRDVQPYGDDEIWLCSDAGLMRLNDEALTALSFEGGAPHVAQRAGDVVVAAVDSRVFELELESGLAFEAPYDFGQVRSIGAGVAGAVYLATDRGLFERDASGSYTHYPLDGREVLGLSHHAKDGALALTADGIWAARPGEPLAPIMAIDEPALAFAADALGNVWLGRSDAAAAYAVGTPIGFDEDVAPVLETYCATCHRDGDNGAPGVAFDDIDVVVAMASTIVTRIANGQMPPAGYPALSADDIDILESWLLTGTHP